MRRALLLAFAAVFTASAQLSPADQSALVEKVKVAGAAYSEQLMRFSASQHKLRTTAPVNDRTDAKWKLLERQDSDLDFDAGKLKYKLRRVDGSEKNPERRVKQGYLNSWGEFEAIKWVFAPKRKASVVWDHQEADGPCVLSYRVPQATSELNMNANAYRMIFAYQGWVFVDCVSGNIARVQVKTDPAVMKMGRREVPVGVDLDVRYAPVEIAGQSYLLPNQAVIIGQFNKTLTKAEMSFSGYRKYEASSSIVFGEP